MWSWASSGGFSGVEPVACDAGDPRHHPVGRYCSHDGDGDEGAQNHWESGGGGDKCTYYNNEWVETDDGEDCSLVSCRTLGTRLCRWGREPCFETVCFLDYGVPGGHGK